jgi:hypothetical protein
MPQSLNGFHFINVFEEFIQFSVKKGILNKSRHSTSDLQTRETLRH